MAIVGTAYVATKVISDSLSKDIKKSVEKALDDAAPAVEKSAKKMGDDIGKSMSSSMGDSVDRELKTKVKPKFDNFSRSTQQDMDKAFRELGESMGKSILPGLDKWERRTKSINQHTKGLRRVTIQAGDAILGVFGKIGPMFGAISALVIGATQVLSAYIGQATALVLPLGQAIGAAGGVAASGLFAVLAAGGALFAAFKTETPTLERFKEAMASIGSEFRVIGESVQQELLPSLAVAFDTLTATIPTLTGRLTEMGAVLGQVAIDFADMVTSAGKLDQLDRALEQSTGITAALGAAGVALADAFISIAAAAGPVTQRFADWVALTTQGWAASANAADETGRLTDWFNMAGDVAAQLGTIFGSVFGALYNILQAGSGAASDLLDRMEAAAGRWEEWTGSIEGQAALREWFEDGAEVATAFNGLLSDIFGMLGRIATADEGGAVGLIDALRSLVPVIEGMVPSLVELTQVFGEFLTEMAESGSLGLLTAALIAMFEALTALLSIPGFGAFLGLLLGLLPVVAIIGKIAAAFSALMPVLAAVWGAIQVVAMTLGFLGAVAAGWVVAIVAAVAAVIAAAIWLWQNWDQVVQWLKDAWQSVVDAVQTAGEWITGVWNSMIEALQAVGQWFSDIWQAVVDTVSAAVDAVLEFFSPLIEFFSTTIPTVLGILKAIWFGFFAILMLPVRVAVGLVLIAWEWLKEKTIELVRAVVDWVSDKWNTLVEKLREPMERARQAVLGKWEEIKAGFKEKVNSIMDWFRDKWAQLKGLFEKPINDAKEGIRRAMDAIKGFAQGAWDGIKSGIQGAWSVVKGVINTMIDGINKAIRGLNTLITGANKLPGPDIPLVPTVPRLAKGGVVSPLGGGTLALIAEAGRPERVEPLDSQGLSRRDRALISALGGGGATEVRVFIGDRELTDIIRVEQYQREHEVSRQLVGGMY